jgi:hypothetical protein
MRFRSGRPVRRIGPPLLGRRRLRPASAPALLDRLSRAHGLFAAGRFAEAAALFEELGRKAQADGLPRAPRFLVQAARANWRAGKVEPGMDLLRTAVDLLASAGAVGILGQIVRISVSELNSLGLKKEAEVVRIYASQKAPGWEMEPAREPAATAKPVLPVRCPQCGGAIRPDEVDWIDDRTAECAYCGSPLRPEK